MDDSPPRRSRRPTNNRKDATFPLIPFLIGVVILGFVIGAGLSMAGHHGSRQQVAAVATATAEPTDTPAPTLAPLATHAPVVATAEPTDDASSGPQSPEPASSPSLKPSSKPASLASPLPSPSASGAASASKHVVKAAAHPSPAPAVASSATPLAAPVTPVPLHSHQPAVVTHQTPPSYAVKSTASPAAAETAAATAAPATAAAATSIEADSDFGRLSANVVKQYLRALSRGDTESASAALQSGSNDTSAERAVLDSTAQIGSITSRGSAEVQTVNATITNSAGSYTGTYTLHRTPSGAAVIVSHTISKS